MSRKKIKKAVQGIFNHLKHDLNTQENLKCLGKNWQSKGALYCMKYDSGSQPMACGQCQPMAYDQLLCHIDSLGTINFVHDLIYVLVYGFLILLVIHENLHFGVWQTLQLVHESSLWQLVFSISSVVISAVVSVIFFSYRVHLNTLAVIITILYILWNISLHGIILLNFKLLKK